jgi:hypothetical protein
MATSNILLKVPGISTIAKVSGVLPPLTRWQEMATFDTVSVTCQT